MRFLQARGCGLERLPKEMLILPKHANDWSKLPRGASPQEQSWMKGRRETNPPHQNDGGMGFGELDSRDGLVLQNTHDDPTILSLTVGGLAVTHLLTFAHSTGSQHSGERNLALLQEDGGYIIGPVNAQLLVNRRAALEEA
jgi:hypothetical protein